MLEMNSSPHCHRFLYDSALTQTSEICGYPEQDRIWHSVLDFVHFLKTEVHTCQIQESVSQMKRLNLCPFRNRRTG